MGKAVKAIAAPVTGGLSLVPGAGKALGGAGGFLGNIFGGAFEDKIVRADPEAAELRAIKLKAAQGESTALDKFRERMEGGASDLIKGDIAKENLGLLKAQEGTQRSLRDAIAQRGLGNSSVGLNALANVQKSTADQVAANQSSFRRRLDDENMRRLSDFRNVAAGTLSNQQVPIKFNDTKEDSYAKTLVRGGITGLVQSGAKAGGGALMGGGA